jgi:hypothetical protein
LILIFIDDKEIVLININERMRKDGATISKHDTKRNTSKKDNNQSSSSQDSDSDSLDESKPKRKKRKRKRRREENSASESDDAKESESPDKKPKQNVTSDLDNNSDNNHDDANNDNEASRDSQYDGSDSRLSGAQIKHEVAEEAPDEEEEEDDDDDDIVFIKEEPRDHKTGAHMYGAQGGDMGQMYDGDPGTHLGTQLGPQLGLGQLQELALQLSSDGVPSSMPSHQLPGLSSSLGSLSSSQPMPGGSGDQGRNHNFTLYSTRNNASRNTKLSGKP